MDCIRKEHEVPVVDLYAQVMAQFKPDEKHPPYTQYAKEMEKRGAPLHAPLVEALSNVARELE